jgi:hypothetical protein
MIKKIYKILSYFYKPSVADIIIKDFKKNFFFKKYKNQSLINLKLGNKNKKKIFYVIRISPGGGFFSNFGYVLNHLKIAYEKGYEPIVDMNNFPTIYNEKRKIKNTMNAWEYYFHQFKDRKLEDVYKSYNVIFTGFKYLINFEFNFGVVKKFRFILKKYVKIRNDILKDFNSFKNKHFKKKKILAVFFRAGDMRISPNHPFPPTYSQIINATHKVLNKNKCSNIFLYSEEERFLKKFKKIFCQYNIIIYPTSRIGKNHPYFSYTRNNHRYKLGKELLIQMLLLSQCHYLIYSESNIIEAAKLYNLNKNQMLYKLDNGYNSSTLFIARWLWYIRSFLPSYFGGFTKELI